MAGLLDYLTLTPSQGGGLLDSIGNWAGNNSNALIGLGAGIAGGGPNWNAAVGRGLQGFQSGQQMDQKERLQKMTLAYMMGGQGPKGSVDPIMAQLIVNNPDWLKEYGKAAISPPMTVGPDGTVIHSGPMGAVSLPPNFPGFPVAEKGPELTNPDGSKSPGGYVIKPSVANPQGYVVNPYGPPPASNGVGSPTGGLPANDPTLSVIPRQVITEQSPQATEEQKKVGATLGEAYDAIQKESTAATKTIPVLQRMKQLNLDPNLPQGALAPAFNTVRSLLISMGVPSNSIKSGEELTMLHNRMVLDMNPSGSLGSGFSNADRSYMDALAPDLNNTREGRAALIEASTKIQERKQEIGKLADRYKAANRGSLQGFQTALAEWSNMPENQLFKEPPPSGSSAAVGSPGQVKIISVR